MRKEDASAPRTWDELYAHVEGAGDDLVLPPREREPARLLQLGDNRTADQSD